MRSMSLKRVHTLPHASNLAASRHPRDCNLECMDMRSGHPPTLDQCASNLDKPQLFKRMLGEEQKNGVPFGVWHERDRRRS